MFRVSPLALGACARAPHGNSSVMLASANRIRASTATVISSQLSRPLIAGPCSQLIASRQRRKPDRLTGAKAGSPRGVVPGVGALAGIARIPAHPLQHDADRVVDPRARHEVLVIG